MFVLYVLLNTRRIGNKYFLLLLFLLYARAYVVYKERKEKKHVPVSMCFIFTMFKENEREKNKAEILLLNSSFFFVSTIWNDLKKNHTLKAEGV